MSFSNVQFHRNIRYNIYELVANTGQRCSKFRTCALIVVFSHKLYAALVKALACRLKSSNGREISN